MKSFLVSCGIALAAFGWLAVPAQAGSIFGVDTLAQAGGQGCGATQRYSTDDGGSGGQSTSPSNISIDNCSNVLNGTPGPAGLTSAFSQVDAFAENNAGPVDGHAYSAADLATGALHGISGPGGFGGFAISDIWDTLTFNTTGPVQIPFTFGVDGTGTLDSRSALLCFTTGNASGTLGCGHSGQAVWEWHLAPVDGFAQDQPVFGGEIDSNSFVTFNVVTNDPGDFLVNGTLFLSGTNPVVGFRANLSLDSNNGDLQDFSHTATLTFDPPDGVSFTSASGVFDTAQAPEPSTFGLAVLGGLLAVICLFRRPSRQVRR